VSILSGSLNFCPLKGPSSRTKNPIEMRQINKKDQLKFYKCKEPSQAWKSQRQSGKMRYLCLPELRRRTRDFQVEKRTSQGIKRSRCLIIRCLPRHRWVTQIKFVTTNNPYSVKTPKLDPSTKLRDGKKFLLSQGVNYL